MMMIISTGLKDQTKVKLKMNSKESVRSEIKDNSEELQRYLLVNLKFMT